VSDPQQFTPVGPKKDKFTPEMRILAASLLSMGVILLWAKYFGPKPPATLPTQAPAAQTSTANPGAASQPNSTTPSSTPQAKAAAVPPAATAAIPPRADSQERAIVIENDLYRVEISNRGAVVKSWQLKKYLDDSKPQRVLDVVHPEASKQTGGWPFSLAMDDAQMEAAANSGLYQVSSTSSSLSAPADAEFSWSDGRLEVTKHFYFDHTYVVRVETSVKYNGAPVTAGLAWRGGFGDLTVTNPIPVETVTTYYAEGGKLTSFAYKKLDGPEKWGGTWQGGKDYAGIADRYFTAAFLPANGAAPGTLETRYWRVFHSIQADGKEASEAVPEVATASKSQQPQILRVYVGPKDYDDLKKMNPPLHALVQFGWMEIIADPLFHLLKWLHTYIPNWGWTIVVLTLVINMLLFPLRITSYKTTMKMQRVAPEIKAIQDRYKKYKMNDPRKAEMNKEVMAVYSREGINPLGSCFQMFLQMPIWFGLNTALRYAIELRHATWAWITDLSSKDPYYILPVVVGVTMYLVSKMTPMTSTDPQQQQMMKLMPISFAVMFVVFPFSSGLALYILTSSLVGIGQQWYLNRAHPVTAPVKPARGKK
jgi:YidC/Oxa1 family membrane protein insertase